MLVNIHTKKAFFPPLRKQYSEGFLKQHREIHEALPYKGVKGFSIADRAHLKK